MGILSAVCSSRCSKYTLVRDASQEGESTDVYVRKTDWKAYHFVVFFKDGEEEEEGGGWLEKKRKKEGGGRRN